MTNFDNILVARIKREENEYLRLFFPMRQEPIVEFSMSEFTDFLNKHSKNGLNYSYMKGSLHRRDNISLVYSVIVDNMVEKSYPTLVGVDDSGERFQILYPDSSEIVELSSDEYLDLRLNTCINNEALRTSSVSHRLRLGYYNSSLKYKYLVVAYVKPKGLIKVVPTQGQATENVTEEKVSVEVFQSSETQKTMQNENTEIIQDSVETTQNEGIEIAQEDNIESTQNHDVGTIQNDTVKLLSKAELEDILSEIDSDSDTQWKEKYIEETSAETALVDVPYKELIWNMYPGDRITVPNTILGDISHVLLRILDSDLDGKHVIAICKIFKQVRTKCTWALLDINNKRGICSIQVIGQSDIADKLLPYKSIDDFCIRYTEWLRDNKFIRR